MKNYTKARKNKETEKGDLKKETEEMVMAIQDEALRTRYMCKVTAKGNIEAKGGLCGDRSETVAHVLAECKMLAQNHFKN